MIVGHLLTHPNFIGAAAVGEARMTATVLP
jgi:hypothetical protein